MTFYCFLLFIQTNLGDIVQDDGMHMVDIVVDNDSNSLLFAAFFYGRVNVAIDIDSGIVVTVPSYNGHSGVV